MKLVTRIRDWFEFDLAVTRMALMRTAPDLEPFFSAPAQFFLRLFRQYGIRG